MTTTVFETKFKEFDNKIPDLSGLVKETEYDTKISGIEKKHIAAFCNTYSNKFMSCILDIKIKQRELVNKSNISKLVKNSDLNTNHATLATKSEFKAEQDKIVKLEAFN